MCGKRRLILLTLVALAALSGQEAFAQRGERQAHRGRCHMDICSWSIDLAKKLVGRNESGSLFELTVKTGTSFHRNGSYQRRTNIEWDSAPRSVWIFCSRQYPTIMVRADSALQSTVLKFADDGVPGAMEAAARTYLRVCHAPAGIYDIARSAKRFGYPRSDRDFSDIERAIRKPEDILSIAAARK